MQRFPLQAADDDGPVFNAPWEAQAFGLVIALYEKGLFSWDEWALQLSEQIAIAQAEGDPDLGNTYYQHWMRALEKLVAAKGLSSAEEIGEKARQWQQAYQNTPHGMPVKIVSGDDEL